MRRVVVTTAIPNMTVKSATERHNEATTEVMMTAARESLSGRSRHGHDRLPRLRKPAHGIRGHGEQEEGRDRDGDRPAGVDAHADKGMPCQRQWRKPADFRGGYPLWQT